MKVLLTAFEGYKNSSKILVDKLSKQINCDNLILVNNKEQSVFQLYKQIENINYDIIMSFGQKPVIKDKVYIETTGKYSDSYLETLFPYVDLQQAIQSHDYDVKISSNAGTSFCNHIYYYGLDRIYQKRLNSKMIFLHIPMMKNITDINQIVMMLTEYIRSLDTN